MLQRTILKKLQQGVHTPKGQQVYNAAKMKNWPEQKIPPNFNFTAEQRFRVKAMPRDIGRIPRDFVLSVLYRHQPCPVDGLWDLCSADPAAVLDSKRHLREVLKQAREEGFVTFDKNERDEWTCTLCRERYEEVRRIVNHRNETGATMSSLRGSSVAETSEYSQTFQEMNDEARAEHLKLLQEQVALTSEKLRKFQKTEIDYLPYTDLNGKVNFMWWYESRDQSAKAGDSLPESETSPAVVDEKV